MEEEETGESWEGFNEAVDGGIIPKEQAAEPEPQEEENTELPSVFLK